MQDEEVMCTLECKLLDVSQGYCGTNEDLTFPGLPPRILITLELIRSMSGRCTRVAAIVIRNTGSDWKRDLITLSKQSLDSIFSFTMDVGQLSVLILNGFSNC